MLNGTTTPIAVNAATNQLSSAYYDANGNMTSGAGATLAYDVSNRLEYAQETGGGIEYYGYAPDNKRVFRQLASGQQQLTFYGARGEKLGVYQISGGAASLISQYVWFGKKLIFDGNPVYPDRLGTNRSSGASYTSYSTFLGTAGAPSRYLPYGEELTSTPNDHMKFGTYTRDSYTGLDYADQRYYASTYGRFATADSSGVNLDPSDPASWNMYSYTEGDPINYYDPTGLATTCGDSIWTQTGQTLNSIVQSGSNLALVAETIFTESAQSTTTLGSEEMGAIGAVIMNRWQRNPNGDRWITPSGS